MKFKVGVEKRMYAAGTVTVDCDTPKQAIDMVRKQIDRGTLQTTNIRWGAAQYEDSSFDTTGEVDGEFVD